MALSVADLHCDLLAYLAFSPGRSVADPASRCSVPQLRAGGVRLQVTAIFTVTGEESKAAAARQAALFADLERSHPDVFRRVRTAGELPRLFDGSESRVGILAAVENASGFCDEREPWEDGLACLRSLVRDAGPLAYVSLTWNDENRFGGGNKSHVGLKDDGRRLLDELHGSGTAVDLSHASDALAADVLRHIDERGLDVPVMASHSNFRDLCEHARNLPPEIASEIARRGGIVGINFMAPFAGRDHADNLLRQIERGCSNGDGSQVALGADFYCSEDLTPSLRAGMAGAPFFEEYPDASAYPAVLGRLAQRGEIPAAALERIAWRNACDFLDRNLSRAGAGGAT